MTRTFMVMLSINVSKLYCHPFMATRAQPVYIGVVSITGIIVLSEGCDVPDLSASFTPECPSGQEVQMVIKWTCTGMDLCCRLGPIQHQYQRE